MHGVQKCALTKLYCNWLKYDPRCKTVLSVVLHVQLSQDQVSINSLLKASFLAKIHMSTLSFFSI